MSFESYLVAKKIDARAFGQADPELFAAWKSEFHQMHAASFTMQKLNLINPIRRKYPLRESPAPVTPPSGPSSGTPKPVMKPKPKIN